MDIKSISALYTERHTVSHAGTQFKCDADVNHVLDCKVARESKWTRQQSITVNAQKEFEEAEHLNTVEGFRPWANLGQIVAKKYDEAIF